jgi:FkbM family methyltransferase
MARDGYESEEIESFLQLLASHDAVIDIGANVGLYSCLAASSGKQAIAVEPVPRNLNYLYRNLWENEFRDVEVFPLGLAAKCGLGRIYGYGGIASFVPGWAQAREAQFSLVPLTTLDTIAAGRFTGGKLLIKMDVEGFELDVLAGAAETLERSPKPAWLVEILLRGEVVPGGISRRFTETFKLFWAHGYRSKKLDSALTPVGPDQVSHWVENGFVDGDAHNFLFSVE